MFKKHAVWIFVGCMVVFEAAFMVYLTSDRSHLRYFNYVMFLPAISAWVAWLLAGRWKDGISALLPGEHAKGYFFSVLYPLLFLLVLTLFVWGTGLGEYQSGKSWFRLPSGSLYSFVMAICLVLGEEWGWRGFLLPELTSKHGKFKAALLVGIGWALFHAPVVYLLAYHLKTADPVLLVLIHMATVLVFSFPFAYSYFHSKSVWAPVLFHYLWNWLNPMLLGNLYRNQSGAMKGNLLLINGEGILGCLLTLLFVAWYWKKTRGETAELA